MATYQPTHAHTGHHHVHGPTRSAWDYWKRAIVGVITGVVLGFIITFLARWLFGFDGLWASQVYWSVCATLAGLGFIIGIGCFDWWWDYLRGRKVDYEDHSLHGARSIGDYFRPNTDHKVIGIQYLVLTFGMFIVGGILAELVRLELAFPGQTIADGETYNGFFSGHATVMIFGFVIPVFGGLANYILPIMIGAKDMAFPRLNALSFWLLVPAGVMLGLAQFVGAFSAGWTAYTPLALQGTTGQTLFEIAVQFAGASSIATALNFLVTVMTMRAPGMTVWRMPLFVWAQSVTAGLVVFGTPFIAGSQFMTWFDRVMGTNFFNVGGGGDVLMYQHVFWFYSHPAVYIMMLPGFGIISDVISTFARKPLFGYRALAFSTVAIAVLGFGVWAHHMFVSGMPGWLRFPMMIMTIVIAVPTGVKVFSWLGTMWGGKIHLKTPMLWAMGFVFTFVIGGLSGVFLGTLPADIQLTDTYYVVAHIHYVFFGGSVFTIFAGLYYWFRKMTGRMYNERLGQIHFWLTFVGFNATFFPMHWLGAVGMPRRVADYDERFADLNLFISIASLGMVIGTAIFFYNAINSWIRGPKAPWNPWRGRSLEWLVSSPPSLFNFDAVPQVVGGPYQYGLPGARHAVIFAGEDLGGGELTEVDRRTMLVVANESVGSQALTDRVRQLAASGVWRFTFLMPVEDGNNRAAERRLQSALSVLAAEGIDANGSVVSGDPLSAIRTAVADDDPQQILLVTQPRGASPWLDRDMVDRVRKASNRAVTHMVISGDDARTPTRSSAVQTIAVVANDAMGEGLATAVQERADGGPVSAVVLCPLSLDGPGWTDDAESVRDAAAERARAVIASLQEAGIPARGEVIDGDPAEAARIARDSYGATSVLVGTIAGRGDADIVEAVTAAAQPVPVEHVFVEAAPPAL